MATTGTAQDDGGFVLDGEKVFVTGAHKADWCCTIARTDRVVRAASAGLSMFLVDMNDAGRRRSSVTRPRTAGRLATVRFDGARVGDDAVLGEVGEGWRQLSGALLAERSGVAWLGWATRAARSAARPLRGQRAIGWSATSSRGW